jgi:uncharacterized OB-fold protein
LSDTATTDAKPGVACLHLDETGRAFVQGWRCRECQAVSSRETLACTACGARGALQAFEASRRGVVIAYTVVMRSYPGVAVPFVSAIVDLEDGITLRGTLKGVEPKASPELFGLPVKVEFETIRPDHAKPPFVIYVFKPA